MEQNQQVKSIQPKRFVDRKDKTSIIKSCGGFYKRGHEQVPGWMITLFFIIQMGFVSAMIYFSIRIVSAMQQKSEILSVIQYLLLVFAIVTAYSLYIVKRLKTSLTATEFMSLFLAKSLEAYSSCFALINKDGKVVYFNENFAKEYMSNGDVENKKYPEVLDKNVFNDNYLGLIDESLRENKENAFSIVHTTPTSQTMRNIKIIPLPRPEGLFVIKIITVKIIKGAKPANNQITNPLIYN
jgi:hypothetical protein